MGKDIAREITRILARNGHGEAQVAEELLPEVYGELRALAGNFFRRERPEHTLQPTALVHEAFIKMTGSTEAGWESRAHFLALAAMAMRRILTDHARRRKASKRGGGLNQVTLSGLATPSGEEQIDLIALDDALEKLAARFPRQSRIVEMRFLAGMTTDEAAHVLGVTARTVHSDWRLAKAFLRCELSGDSLS